MVRSRGLQWEKLVTLSGREKLVTVSRTNGMRCADELRGAVEEVKSRRLQWEKLMTVSATNGM